MADYRGKVLLIVNTASKCGFTPQYAELEALYRDDKDRGFEVLAFPCNQFGAQEPGDADEIANFCSLTYDVSFPLMAKIDVNGDGADPIFKHLKTERPACLAAGSSGISPNSWWTARGRWCRGTRRRRSRSSFAKRSRNCSAKSSIGPFPNRPARLASPAWPTAPSFPCASFPVSPCWKGRSDRKSTRLNSSH